MSTGCRDLLPDARTARCPTRVSVALLLLGSWLWAPAGIGQELVAGRANQSPRFVRQGSRLYRTASFTDQEEGLADEALAVEILGEEIEETVATPHAAGRPRAAVSHGPNWSPRGWWARPEFLLWWLDGYDAPPLVTTSPLGTSRDIAGELEQTSTDVLFGGEALDAEVRPGGRFRLGYWFDRCAEYGLEASYLRLAKKSSMFSADSSLDPVLARPFFNIEPGAEGQDVELVAFPGLLDGHIRVDTQTQLQGVEILSRQLLCQDGTRRVDWLAGYRYLQLDDELVISDFKRFVATGTGLQVGTTIEEFDRFATQNDFHGGELGLVAELRRRRWTLEVLGKVAIGTNRSRATVNGSTTVIVPDPDEATTPYGLLALPGNSGTHAHDALAVIPEIGITLSYQFTPQLRGMLGYTFLYWSQVARPGDQIDLDLNLSQIKPDGLTGPARPEFIWTDTAVWAQGLSLGLDCRF